jgi:hypothetical protein
VVVFVVVGVCCWTNERMTIRATRRHRNKGDMYLLIDVLQYVATALVKKQQKHGELHTAARVSMDECLHYVRHVRTGFW